jgi:hypothetical protein
MTDELLKVLRLDRKKIYSYTVDFTNHTLIVRRGPMDKGIILPLTRLPIREEQIER